MKATNSNKRQHEKAVRVNITLSPKLFEASQDVVRKHGYMGLSDYFQSRIRLDAGMELSKVA